MSTEEGRKEWRGGFSDVFPFKKLVRLICPYHEPKARLASRLMAGGDGGEKKEQVFFVARLRCSPRLIDSRTASIE